MTKKNQRESPIACDMSVLSPAQREAHLTTSRELFANVKEMRELSNGYEFRLDGPDVILRTAEFIALEKLCCPFLDFSLDVEAESGAVCLKLTGREGVKAFIQEEISGLLGTVIDWSGLNDHIQRRTRSV
jgi:hypothetical protein